VLVIGADELASPEHDDASATATTPQPRNARGRPMGPILAGKP
jgi:hypothetical protein